MSNGDDPKAPPPPDDWAKSDTWSDDYFALKEEEKFPNEAELKSAHDQNKIRVVKHSGIIIVDILWVVSLEKIKADSDAFYGDHNLWDGGYESGLEHCAEIARAILDKHKEKV